MGMAHLSRLWLEQSQRDGHRAPAALLGWLWDSFAALQPTRLPGRLHLPAYTPAHQLAHFLCADAVGQMVPMHSLPYTAALQQKLLSQLLAFAS